MLSTFSARAAPETTRGLAARGWPRRGESAAKPAAPGAVGGAEGAPCGFWSALSHRLGRPHAARPRGAHANYFSPRAADNYSFPTISFHNFRTYTPVYSG